MTTTIHLSGPAEVLTVLPYQLGFHPADCLVALSLHGSRMGLVQRIDLPPAEQVGPAVAAMISPLRQDLPDALMLIAFESREGESRPMQNALAAACLARGIRVAHRIVVRGGRWFDLDCTGGCCPAEGWPLPAPAAVPAVAEFVGREICPLPDRSALAELLDPVNPLQGPTVSRLVDQWLRLRLEAANNARAGGAARSAAALSAAALSAAEMELHGIRAQELALWSRVLCDEDDAEAIQALLPQDLAVLAASLTDVHLRDALIAWLCPGTLPQDVIEPILLSQLGRALRAPMSPMAPMALSERPWQGADKTELAQVIGRQRIERRLCELSAALPDESAVATLTVLASFTWWRGDGALTRVALDRALRIDPHYRLAQLLERMVDLAVRPERASA